jgi:flavin-dependent dehydrogenase
VQRIAIVGAGPAGASAGRHLASAGHAVRLFDRAAFPRDKPCGDWLTPLALREIAAQGLDVDKLRSQAGASATIARTSLRAPSGRTSRAGDAMGLCIPRLRLDAVLVAHAVASGCEFVQRAFARVEPGAEGLEGFDLVVDARGSSAGPVNAAGLRGYLTVPRRGFEDAVASGGLDAPNPHDAAASPDATGLLHRLDAASVEVAIRTDARCRRGYGWIFPVDVRDHRVTFNLGVGLWKADIRPGHGPREMLARFLATDPLARVLDRAAIERSRPQGFPLAMGGWTVPRVGHGRWARIGDAAALADPLTGDGIGNALLSGRLLAQAVTRQPGARPLPSPSLPPGDAWQFRFEAEVLPELRRAWLLRQLLMPTRAKNAAAWLLDLAPQGLRQRLHAALFGAESYRQALL